nr:uncharacterized protein LOC111987005 [Quercus suber]
MEAMARTFKPLWHAENGFKFQKEGDHKILFIFDNQEDVDKIVSNEPWSFDKSLVVLQRYDRNSPIEELSFDKASFWVQVHNMPIRYRTKSVAEDICESIGLVHRSDKNSEGGGGSFMRVRVTLNVYQPLCRGHVIKLEEGGKVWVNFKYERLPNICYWCECFDHSDKDCDLWIQSKGTLQLSSQQFGLWLRTVPSASLNKPPYLTWKRLARLLVSSQATPNDCIGCKRSVDMVVDQYELPSKKLVVSSSDKENYPVLAETGFQSR